jgi:hypothetical protein
MADIQDLIELNFIEIGECELINSDTIEISINSQMYNTKNMGSRNVLYAFVSISDRLESSVKYIGKTTKGIETRMSQYKLGYGNSTNNRIKRSIIDLLEKNQSIKIFILADIPALQWGGYNLNLPAGLEDSLIYSFKPDWNNTHGIPKTTLEDFEDEIEIDNLINQTISPNTKNCNSICGAFNWKLGETYYNHSFMNPGVGVDHCFGQIGEIVTLIFPDGTQFQSPINRTANNNRTVRLHFIQAVEYLQNHYNLGDILMIQICPNNQLFVL